MTSIRKAKKKFNKRKPIGVFKFNGYLSQDEIYNIQIKKLR